MPTVLIASADHNGTLSDGEALCERLQKLGIDAMVDQFSDANLITPAEINRYDLIVINGAPLHKTEDYRQKLIEIGWQKGLIIYTHNTPDEVAGVVNCAYGCGVAKEYGPTGLAARITSCIEGRCPRNNCYWRSEN